MQLLAHNWRWVRARAARALGEILQGTASPPEDVIQALETLVAEGDEDEKVAALEALAKIYAREDVCSDRLYDTLLQYKDHQAPAVLEKVREAWVAVSSCFLQDEIEANLPILRHRNPGFRREAVEMLGWIGPAASSAICPLIEALARETVREVQDAIVEALERIGAPPADCVANLLSFLEHETPLVRRTAAEVLGRLPLDAATVDLVNALLEAATDDPDESVRSAAAKALGQLLAQ